ncbi:tyrosine-type recombinase/integrase [Jatrophihabitans sp.]|uniref:tyrosine-type recombinase/integrase n=1 Tax=Jatrophihabitans sp. TaxID=1932789 RepID=UPI0030C6967D|nr:site-specific integrase [Jatrophihabitans sp.]
MTEKMRDGIIQRGKTWSYVVREKDPATGKTKPRWVGGFPTRTAAKRARDEARNAVNRGTYVAPQTLTVADWLSTWISAHEVELKPSTADTYRKNIDRYLIPTIGHERVQALSPSHLSIVFRKMAESGGQGGKPLSGRTVDFARAVLRRAMQDAILERIIEVNPVVGTKRPRQVKPKHTTWTGSQLQTFLDQVQDDRLFPLWALASATGMRRGELCGLQWDDVDLEAAVVSIERSTTQIGNDRVTSTPKNHERRRVQIDARTVATLRTWRKAQAEERLQWGAAYEDTEGLMFTRENGTPILPNYVTKLFGKRQTSAGLARLTVHELRHTHATILLRAGVPVHIVAKRLGHKDPSVTLNVYADVIPEDDGYAVDTFTQAVWGA